MLDIKLSEKSFIAQLMAMPYVESTGMKPATLAKHKREAAKMKKKKKLAKLSRKRNKKG